MSKVETLHQHSGALHVVCISTDFDVSHDVGGENYVRYYLPAMLLQLDGLRIPQSYIR
jgi:hypothetical protein